MAALGYKEVAVFSLLLRSTALPQSAQQRIDSLVLDWFDLHNRRSSQGRVTKEQVTLGVYDPVVTEAAKTLMAIRTQSTTPGDLEALFVKYKSLRDPFLASLFLRRVNSAVSRKGRDAVVFSPAVATEYYKEGFWLACALIHDPAQIPTWRLFLQWLLLMHYYEEDERLFSLFLTTPAPDFAILCPLEYDPALACAVRKTREELPLPFSLNAVLSYLLQSHRDALLQYFPSVIPSPTPLPTMSDSAECE